ncbi:hypothetical protein DPMN_010349 [Dreissena polymorpha]|uniref:Uncharacterized protein n=1 Tax=Dreissena polymorpha TaxID=45954 RepID=A0A9D4N1Y0_DREPO|nr:hypothetical protein DPMN_010349 [Dreissena polymorpha]
MWYVWPEQHNSAMRSHGLNNPAMRCGEYGLNNPTIRYGDYGINNLTVRCGDYPKCEMVTTS